MTNLFTEKMYPTISTTCLTIYVWCILIVLLNPFGCSSNYGVEAWTADILPKLYNSKYGESLA